MKLDILVLAVHPDDAELGCSGTILAHVAQGYKVGIIDLTRGELGTRGTPQIRVAEAEAAGKIMGLAVRQNAKMRDGFLRNDEQHQLQLMAYIRRYQPEIVLANAPEDRHPDHGRAAALQVDACFLAGLRMIETHEADGTLQTAWRPKKLYHYIQDRYLKPDFVVDISAHWEQKLATIRAFKSQFFDPNSSEPDSYISSPEFMDFLAARSQEMGHTIGAKYGEGFIKNQQLQVHNLLNL